MAGFWRRVGAFLIDGAVLGAVGWAAGLVLSDQFVQLGPWGRLLGFCVAWPYFGLLNGPMGGGQTLGKRALGIKVVDKDGGTLSWPRSFARFLPLGAVWFLNGAQWPEAVVASGLVYLLSLAIFGVGLAVVYLFVFNRVTRQSLHDLLVGSFVVRARGGDIEPIQAQPTWPVHLVVCGVLLVGGAVLPFFGQRAAGNEFFAPLRDIQKVVGALNWVGHVQVNKGQSLVVSAEKGKTETTYLNISVFIKDADIDSTERAKQVAKLALAADPGVRNLDVIQVVLLHGHDIGISASWRSRSHSHAPAEWQTQP